MQRYNYANIVDVYDVFELQNALDALTDWAKTWQLAISIKKILCFKNWENQSGKLVVY